MTIPLDVSVAARLSMTAALLGIPAAFILFVALHTLHSPFLRDDRERARAEATVVVSRLGLLAAALLLIAACWWPE